MDTQTNQAGTKATPVAIASALSGSPESAVAATPVRLTGQSVDFGDGDFMNNQPVGFGYLSWDLGGGTITPHLTGKLYLKNAMGVTARMQLRYFDVHGNVLSTQVGGSVTANDNDLHSWTVDLDPYSNPRIYRVDVSTTVEGQPGSWLTVSIQHCYLSSTTQPADGVRLTGVGVDFGDLEFVNNAPVGFGLLSWDLGNDTITPHLTGKLYLKNSMGVTARMQMRYFDVHGNILSTRAGGSVTANNNKLRKWTVDLAPYSNPLIYRVDVSTTVEGEPGQWFTVASQTFHI